MPTADREGLREALARTLAVQDGWQNPDALWTDNIGLISRGHEGHPVYQDYLEEADALIAGPLSDLLAQADTAAQAVVERDEARRSYRGLLWEMERGGRVTSVYPQETYRQRVEEADARTRAAQAEAARLSAEVEARGRALTLLLPFVDFAAGEGLSFEPTADDGAPPMDAADLCTALAKALGIEIDGREYANLLAAGHMAIQALALAAGKAETEGGHGQ